MHVAEQLKVGYYCLFLFIVYVAAKMKISTSLEKAQCVWPGALRTDKTFRRNVTFEQITEGHNQVDHRYLCRKKKNPFSVTVVCHSRTDGLLVCLP